MKWIVLLRGINVGGSNILPMADLRAILEGLGFTGVKTYIQSGNCIIESSETDPDKISGMISEAIEQKFTFRPKIMTIKAETLDKALASNPFPQADENPKLLHMFFMTETPDEIDDELLRSIQKEGEDYAYIDHVFYLYAPDGIWKSKIGARVEKIIGVPMTARNLRTVIKLQGMVEIS